MTLLAISCYDTSMHSRDVRYRSDPGAWFVPYTGGVFCVFDWEKDEVTWQVAIDSAAGFCWKNNLLYIAMQRFSEVVALDGYGSEKLRFSHKSLNEVHTIVPTRNGFLLTSTGTDSIIEINSRGEMLYEWCALDHGYKLMTQGKMRILERSIDQRFCVYTTESHTTHVNSACFADPDEQTILATLFHQGTVIAIDRLSGQVQSLISGLNKPHDVRPYLNKGWIVSDTRNNQTLLFDKEWKIYHRISKGFDWVQSSAPLADGSIVIVDTNNHRLVRVYGDDFQSYEERLFPPDWRLYLASEIPSERETFFQQPIVSSLAFEKAETE